MAADDLETAQQWLEALNAILQQEISRTRAEGLNQAAAALFSKLDMGPLSICCCCW